MSASAEVVVSSGTEPAEITCSKCGRTGTVRPDRPCSLPVNWEHPEPGGHCRAVSINGRSPEACETSSAVCGRCILDLLDSLLAELHKAATAGRF